MKSSTLYTIILLNFMLMISCAPIDNPVDPGFKGDYSFTIEPSWSSNDTLAVFSPYTIRFVDMGEDTFASWKVRAATEGVLYGGKQEFDSRTDSASLLFLREYSGYVHVYAVRPNRREMTDSVYVHAKNFFSVSGPSVTGPDGAKYSVISTSEDFSGEDNLTIDWYIGDSALAEEKPFSSALNLSDLTAGEYELEARISGFGSQLIVTKNILVEALQDAPALSSTRLELQGTAGSSIVISAPSVVSGEPAVWNWDLNQSGSADTTTKHNNITRTFDEAGEYPIVVWFTDTSSVSSNRCTITVVVSEQGTPVVTNAVLSSSDAITGETVSLTVSASVDGDQTIDTLVIDTNGTVFITVYPNTATVDTTFNLRFSNSGSYTTGVVAKTEIHESTRLEAGVITVTSGQPVINELTPQRILRGVATDLSIIFEAPRTVKAFSVWMEQDSTPSYSSENLFIFTFEDTGSFTFNARVRDTAGVKSAVFTSQIEVVSEGEPVVESVTADTSEIYAHHNRNITVSALDSDGEIEMIFLKTNTAGIIDSAEVSGASAEHTFPVQFSLSDTGKVEISASARDDDGRYSAWKTLVIEVKPGYPVMDSLVTDKSVLYTRDSVMVKFGAHDPNGTIESYYFSHGQGFEPVEGNEFAWTPPEAGTFTLKVFAIDNDGLHSDTLSTTAEVNEYTASLDNITTDTDRDEIFILSPVRFTVHGNVTGGGNLDNITLVLGSADPQTKSAEGDSAVFEITFTQDQAGTQVLKFSGTDDLGRITDTLYDTVNVRTGRPVVVSIETDPEPDTIFVNTQVTFTVTAEDTNGTVDFIKVDTGSGSFGEWQEMSGDTYQFTAEYDTSQYGSKTVRVRVMDNHGLVSEIEQFEFNVRLGRPVVWGNTPDGDQDTIFVVVDNGLTRTGVKYYAKVNAYDNGTIERYYWANTKWPDTNTVTTVDSLEWNVDQARINNGVPQYIHVRDNDGLVAGKKFVIVADSAPPVPSVTSDAVDEGRKLSWSGMDVIDSLDTEYRILIKKGSQLTESDTTEQYIVQDWRRGGDFEFDGQKPSPFSFTFVPEDCESGTCTYYYRIMARDRHGSVSKSALANNNFHWTPPKDDDETSEDR
ncbi:Glycoprotein gp2 [Chitinispirillum alkaliphilum]|nr:Glycoprotein gp2 [Chitinispirillum alkaliphilum]